MVHLGFRPLPEKRNTVYRGNTVSSGKDRHITPVNPIAVHVAFARLAHSQMPSTLRPPPQTWTLCHISRAPENQGPWEPEEFPEWANKFGEVIFDFPSR